MTLSPLVLLQQRQQTKLARQTVPNTAAGQPAASQPPQLVRAPPPPPSPTKNRLQEPSKPGAPGPVSATALPQSSGNAAILPSSSETVSTSTSASASASATGPEAMQVELANTASNKDLNPPPQETPMEEAIRVTRGRLKKRAAAAGGA